MSIIPRTTGSPSSAGPLVVGQQLLFALFGILSVQMYLYHLCSRDRVLIRVLVYGVYILMLAQLILAGRDFYVRVTSEGLGVENLGWISVPLIGGTVGAVVQIFYAWRIHILSKQRVGPCILATIAIISVAAAYIAAAFGSRISTISGLNSDSLGLRIGSTIWYASSAACDIAITVYMTYLLTRNKDLTSNTRAAVDRILRLTFETNALTSGMSVVTLVLLLILPGQTYFTTFALLLPGIYANTFLIMLNLRLRHARSGVMRDSTFKLSSFPQLPTSRSSRGDVDGAIDLQNDREGGENESRRRLSQERRSDQLKHGGIAL
ncbi:hypothetical protein L218DRAFT_995754 [Marasmius fiardii PR-910]|nr:hypothetical protein L218DRAFT_995754 [Marasmius fiardii PR-910]